MFANFCIININELIKLRKRVIIDWRRQSKNNHIPRQSTKNRAHWSPYQNS